jgi:uncharacterized protein
VLAEESRRTAKPIARGVGLIGRRGLPENGGLVIEPCNSVVSFFMRFPIDVLFLNSEGKVLHQIRHMIPWRTSKIVRGAKVVVELPSGTLEKTGTESGDRIEIRGV